MPGHYNDNWEWVDDEYSPGDLPQEYNNDPPPPSETPGNFAAPLPQTPTPAPNENGPSPTPPPGGGGGGMSEDEGRAYDNANGLMGGYMTSGGWVHGSPRNPQPQAPGYPGDDALIAAGYTKQPDGSWYNPAKDTRNAGGGGGGGRSIAFGTPPALKPISDYWTPWTPPTWEAPVYGGYPDFSYESFSDPTADEAKNMPGYQFAVGEGIQRLGNERAAKGTYLGGPTLKAIGSWVTDYGMQSYGNLRDQKLSTYRTNRDNAADTWMRNYGVSKDTFDTNYGGSRDQFDRSYKGSYDVNQDSRRAAELQFGRDWDLYDSWLNTQKFLIGQGND